MMLSIPGGARVTVSGAGRGAGPPVRLDVLVVICRHYYFCIVLHYAAAL